MEDKFIPDREEPHLHVHKNGITFTNVGHRHTELTHGSIVYNTNIDKVLLYELEDVKESHKKAIIKYLKDEGLVD